MARSITVRFSADCKDLSELKHNIVEALNKTAKRNTDWALPLARLIRGIAVASSVNHFTEMANRFDLTAQYLRLKLDDAQAVRTVENVNVG